MFQLLLFPFSGDEFALRDGNTLFCKMDNDALDKLAQSDIESSAIDFRDGSNQVVTTTNSTNNSSGSNNNSSEFGSMSGTRRFVLMFQTLIVLRINVIDDNY
jgi:hypothetical protein